MYRFRKSKTIMLILNGNRAEANSQWHNAHVNLQAHASGNSNRPQIGKKNLRYFQTFGPSSSSRKNSSLLAASKMHRQQFPLEHDFVYYLQKGILCHFLTMIYLQHHPLLNFIIIHEFTLSWTQSREKKNLRRVIFLGFYFYSFQKKTLFQGLFLYNHLCLYCNHKVSRLNLLSVLVYANHLINLVLREYIPLYITLLIRDLFGKRKKH